MKSISTFQPAVHSFRILTEVTIVKSLGTKCMIQCTILPNIYVECLSVEIHSGSGEESTMSSFGEKKILHLMLTSHRGGGGLIWYSFRWQQLVQIPFYLPEVELRRPLRLWSPIKIKLMSVEVNQHILLLCYFGFEWGLLTIFFKPLPQSQVLIHLAFKLCDDFSRLTY